MKFITAALCSCLVLIPALSLGNHSHYETTKKFNCWTKLDLFLDRGILFSFDEDFLNSWPGYKRFDCQMNVYLRTKATGIIANIQKLKFRKSPTDTCVDYIKFGRDDRLRCGDMRFGLNLLSNGSLPDSVAFVSEYAGPFLSGNSWPESKELLSTGSYVQPDTPLTVNFRVDEKKLNMEGNLTMLIAFTGFKECDGSHIPKGLFNCGYGICILDMFVGDGVVNCPFGDCRDEGSCEDIEQSTIHQIIAPIVESETSTKVLDEKATRLTISGTKKNAYSIASTANEGTSIGIRQRREKWFENIMSIQDGVVKGFKYIGEEFQEQNRMLERVLAHPNA